MREITLVRAKKFSAMAVSAVIWIDSVVVATVKNGETVKLTIDDNAHEICASLGSEFGNMLRIGEGNQDIALDLKPKAPSFNLYVQGSTDNQDSEAVTNIQHIAHEPTFYKQSQVPSCIFGVVLTLVCLGASLIVFSIGETSLLGFVFGVILALASGVVVIMGGFWMFIIPLPFVFIYKIGCTKPNQSLNLKVIFGLLSFILPILCGLALFLLRNV